MKDETTGNTVYYSLDLNNPPELTAEEVVALERLRTMKDEDIDFSDIPRHTNIANWRRAGRARRVAAKERVLVLDEDVDAMYAGAGDARVQKMNAVLREYAEAGVGFPTPGFCG